MTYDAQLAHQLLQAGTGDPSPTHLKTTKEGMAQPRYTERPAKHKPSQLD